MLDGNSVGTADTPRQGLHRPRILVGSTPGWWAQVQAALPEQTWDVTQMGPVLPPDLDAFDLILPFCPADYVALRHAFARGQGNGVNVLLPDPELVPKLHHKGAFADLMHQSGFGDAVPIWRPGMAYPCVVKPAIGAWAQGVRIVWSDAEQRAAIAGLDDPVVQRLVPGETEYAVHILADHGQIITSFSLACAMPDPMCLRGCNTNPLSERLVDMPCPEFFETMIAALDYSGSCCFDLKLEAGRPQLFEINPRIGGSVLSRLSEYVTRYLDYLQSKRTMSQAGAGWSIMV